MVADTALNAEWDSVVFFDDAWPSLNSNDAHSAVGDSSALLRSANEFAGAIVAIGDNRTRMEKTHYFYSIGLPLPIIIHPHAYLSNDTFVGVGTVIFAGAVVQPGVSLGMASIVNTGATIDHNCSIAAGVHICPGAHLAGQVSIGECTQIGIASSVNQNLAIGSDVTVGAGAAVVKDAPDAVTVVGVPARIAEEL